MQTIKDRLLVFEARRWVGMTEIGGNNRGQVVEMFQKAVDGISSGEPWCMSFVQFCIEMVDNTYDAMFQQSYLRSPLKKTEHCMTLWQDSQHHVIIARPGSLAIWQYWKNGSPTSSGHVGIVTEVITEPQDHIRTIEGNTGGGSEIEREGDGVYEKVRSREGGTRMKLMGFLSVW